MPRWTAVFVIAAALIPTTASGSGPSLKTLWAEATTATWTCQDQLGVPRSPKVYDPWAPHSRAFRADRLNHWKLALRGCLQKLHARADVWRRLQRGLAGSPMAGSERELEAAGRRHGVSPFFIAAIAATESSLYEAGCGNYNAWGLANCSGIWDVPYFRSWADAYEFMARFLASRWPHARTPYDYRGYARCSSCWGAKTASHMRRLFGVEASTRYP